MNTNPYSVALLSLLTLAGPALAADGPKSNRTNEQARWQQERRNERPDQAARVGPTSREAACLPASALLGRPRRLDRSNPFCTARSVAARTRRPITRTSTSTARVQRRAMAVSAPRRSFVLPISSASSNPRHDALPLFCGILAAIGIRTLTPASAQATAEPAGATLVCPGSAP